jgi:hypothetical protein
MEMPAREGWFKLVTGVGAFDVAFGFISRLAGFGNSSRCLSTSRFLFGSPRAGSRPGCLCTTSLALFCLIHWISLRWQLRHGAAGIPFLYLPFIFLLVVSEGRWRGPRPCAVCPSRSRGKIRHCRRDLRAPSLHFAVKVKTFVVASPRERTGQTPHRVCCANLLGVADLDSSDAAAQPRCPTPLCHPANRYRLSGLSARWVAAFVACECDVFISILRLLLRLSWAGVRIGDGQTDRRTSRRCINSQHKSNTKQ